MPQAKTIHIALWCFGLCSGLACIIYFPLLIWSPPWGINGFYSNTEDEFFYMHEHTATRNSIGKNFSIYQREFPLVKHAQHFTYTEPHVIINIKFNNNIMHIDSEWIHTGRPSTYMHEQKAKVLNPFDIWYIKLAQWQDRQSP